MKIKTSELTGPAIDAAIAQQHRLTNKEGENHGQKKTEFTYRDQ